MAVSTQRPIQIIRYALAFVLVGGFVAFMMISWRWPIIWDTQVMHYVDFMIGHGRAPYREITDLNMPGTYLFEHFAIRVFGAGDVAWRIYEFFLLSVLTFGMMLIAKPYDWIAGLLAGMMFSLLHGTETAINAVQRDELMTVLIVLAYAALFRAVRRDKPVLTGIAGIAAGFAATIKPTAAPLGLLLVLSACFVIKRHGKPVMRHLLFGVAGLCVGAVVVVLYLLHYHSFKAFFDLLLHQIPNYSTIDRVSYSFLILNSINPQAFLFLMLALFATFAMRYGPRKEGESGDFETWESYALWMGILFGLGSFIAQHKGYLYHRYPTVAFVFLWSSIQLMRGLKTGGLPRVFALVGIAYATLIVVPACIAFDRHVPDYDYFSSYLEQDLEHIGTAPLQYQVQCLDIVYGCMNALYHDRIMQYTGATGDLGYFQPVETPTIHGYRERFWRQLQSSPPAAFVLSNQRYGQENTFDKIQTWPAFAEFLQQNYVLTVQREFEGDKRPTSHPGADSVRNHAYRIYIRKDSPLLAAAQKIQAGSQ